MEFLGENLTFTALLYSRYKSELSAQGFRTHNNPDGVFRDKYTSFVGSRRMFRIHGSYLSLGRKAGPSWGQSLTRGLQTLALWVQACVLTGNLAYKI
jgi:hypothetical protein